MRATIANMKGGTAKSTTTIYLGLGLARQGHRVLLVDADKTNQTIQNWKADAVDWPDSVVVASYGKDLARSVQAVAGDYDDLLVDTGPQDDKIVSQAFSVTEDVIIPVAPSPVELKQLAATFELAALADALSPTFAQVLLVKVRRGTRSSAEARRFLLERNLPVLSAEVHHWEAYSLAYGSVPEDLAEYEMVLKELREGGE